MSKLKSGQKIPLLKGVNSKGETIHLTDFVGKPIIISFYRYSGCKYCNLRIHHFIKRYKSHYQAKGIQAIAVFQSPINKLEEGLYVSQNGDIPFTVIADSAMNWYTSFGVELSWIKSLKTFLRKEVTKQADAMNIKKMENDGPRNRLPADFLINTNGVIEVAHYAGDITDHITLDKIDTWADITR